MEKIMNTKSDKQEALRPLRNAGGGYNPKNL